MNLTESVAVRSACAALLAICGAATEGHSSTLEGPDGGVIKTFVPTHRFNDQWLGFFNDDELFIGSCAPINVRRRTLDQDCRWPDHIRSSIGYPGRDILLLSTYDKDQKWKSYVVTPSSGETLHRASGNHFAPPATLHPTRDIWATTQTAKEGHVESVVVRKINFSTARRARADEGGSHIFHLAFNTDGTKLFVYPQGYVYTYDTHTWKITDESAEENNSPLLTEMSHDRTLTIHRTRERSTVTCRDSNKAVLEAPINSVDETYPVAYSTDMKTIAIRGKSVGVNNGAYGVYLLQSSGAPFSDACKPRSPPP